MRPSDKGAGIWVVAIKDRNPQGFLAFDVADILECLISNIESCVWTAFDVDVVGDAYVAEGELLTTSTLLKRARRVEQTIDGKFLAYNERPVASTARWDYSHFPNSNAVLAVVAVDSSYFEVYTKNPADVRLLKSRFSNVSAEDPAQYFQE